jgi:hypothetical protein
LAEGGCRGRENRGWDPKKSTCMECCQLFFSFSMELSHPLRMLEKPPDPAINCEIFFWTNLMIMRRKKMKNG